MALSKEDRKLVDELMHYGRQKKHMKKLIDLTVSEIEAKMPTNLTGPQKHLYPEDAKRYAPQLTALWNDFSTSYKSMMQKTDGCLDVLEKRLPPEEYDGVFYAYKKLRSPRVTLDHLKVYLRKHVSKPAARLKLLEAIKQPGISNRDADRLFRNAEALNKEKPKPAARRRH